MATPAFVTNKKAIKQKISEALANDRNVNPKSGVVNYFKCAGQPTTYPTGINLGDLCYDYSNKYVYVYSAANTWTKITA